ncbi:MAG TPA: branched-chain amino acid aminotransferase [Propionibacteriaceae bacterium]|nr:branched-chain amino acid aminotransferase [Propionibacteriaceae bacterium]
MSQFELDPTATSTPPEEIARALADPGFGKYFTDHMASATYTPDAGWHGLVIEQTKPFEMHPSAGVLHYGQEIFEGLKAYRRADDSVWLFRPRKNAVRFAASAERLSMAPLPPDLFVDAVTTLVDLDRDWVPAPAKEQSLYIRPFEIASETFLGVRESHEYRFTVIASPVGPYYPDPVWLWATPTFTRAASGGTGAAKCGGNYAASLIAAGEAKQHACDQVLWLDGAEHRWVEECGTMNILFITRDGELITPDLRGTILDGVTRDSLLKLAPHHGLRPVERQIGIHEVATRIASGEICEVLACGTAAVVVPVLGIRRPGATLDAHDITLPVADATPGPKTMAMRGHLLDIQYGRADDPFGWTVRV